jgi:ssDNA-binding Zn-finger/Zn-ribbon topoisomerase 1
MTKVCIYGLKVVECEYNMENQVNDEEIVICTNCGKEGVLRKYPNGAQFVIHNPRKEFGFLVWSKVCQIRKGIEQDED